MSHQPPATSHQTRGMTIIEIIVVVAIGVLIIAALVRFLVAGYPLSKTTYLQARSTESARLQLKRITKNLRESREGDTGAYPLAVAEPQRIIFYSDVDADNTTERVRLELSGSNLIRGLLEPSGDPLVYDDNNEVETTVVSTVRNGSDPIFTYYNGDYPADQTPLASNQLTEVKYISFDLQIDADPDIPPEAISLQTQVQLRNLKTNLGEVVPSPSPSP